MCLFAASGGFLLSLPIMFSLPNSMSKNPLSLRTKSTVLNTADNQSCLHKRTNEVMYIILKKDVQCNSIYNSKKMKGKYKEKW